MMLMQIIFWLFIALIFIIVFTARFQVPAFFVLFIACFIVGIGVHMPVSVLLNTMKEGFGNILKSLGLIIIFGTALGIIFEQTGSASVLAQSILKIAGKKRAALTMSITGFFTGLPVFCDSGFIVLSGLNQKISRAAGQPISIVSVSLATALYSVHCMVPPHPGVSAASVAIGVPFAQVMVWGIVVAIPATIAGYMWAKIRGRKEISFEEKNEIFETEQRGPSLLMSTLPLLVPILLIAIRSIFSIEKSGSNFLIIILNVLGDPIIALAIGVILALLNYKYAKAKLNTMLQEAIEKAGSILVIIGSGGAFGAILTLTLSGNLLSRFPMAGLGIFFPFLLTAILKTAQGSSTVAIITASSILKPFLPFLVLSAHNSSLIAILSMGSGSMMISHANDAYFWVISRFSGLSIKTMYRSYTMSTIIMGLVSLATVWLLSYIL